MRAALLVVALLCVASSARAEKPRVDIDVRSGWTTIGGRHPTGGVTLGLAGSYARPVSESWGWHAGVALTTVGDPGSWHWLGVLGGPEAGVRGQHGALRATITASCPYGQLPVVNSWGLPMRYRGIYPGGSIRLQYAPDGAPSIGAEIGGFVVDTLSWQGAALYGRVVGTLSIL